MLCGTADEERSWQELVDAGEDFAAQYASTNEAKYLQDAIESFCGAATLGLGEARDAATTFLRGARALIPNESSDNNGERGAQVPHEEITLSSFLEGEQGCILTDLQA